MRYGDKFRRGLRARLRRPRRALDRLELPGRPPPVPPDVLADHPRAHYLWDGENWVLIVGEQSTDRLVRQPPEPVPPPPPPPPPGPIPWGWKLAAGLLAAGLVALGVWLIVDDGEGGERAGQGARAEAGAGTTTSAAPTTTSAAEPTDVDLDALAAALGIPRDRLADLLADLEPNEPDYESSDPAAPSDGGVGIVGYGAVAQRDDVVFVMELASAPSTASGEYQYGLGVSDDSQSQSTPNPNAPDGFGRLALSRVWFLSPGGTLESRNAAAGYTLLPTGGVAVIAGHYVTFRIPEDELPDPQGYYLQAFLRAPLAQSGRAVWVTVSPSLVG